MKVSYLNTKRLKGTTVYVDLHEAMAIIESLAGQVKRGNPNSGRWEWNIAHEVVTDSKTTPKGQRYFSLFVVKES